LVQSGSGTTVTITYSGLTGTPTRANILFCATSVSASNCDFNQYSYQIGGFGVSLPSTGTALAVGATVTARGGSGTTTLPSGTYNMNLLDSGGFIVSIATLTNAVIGPGATPSPGASSSAPVAPANLLQQVGLPADGTCTSITDTTLNWAGVSSGGWASSWAQWMNGGKGGAVCNRTLVYSLGLSMCIGLASLRVFGNERIVFWREVIKNSCYSFTSFFLKL
jgi:hypothetical protein